MFEKIISFCFLVSCHSERVDADVSSSSCLLKEHLESINSFTLTAGSHFNRSLIPTINVWCSNNSLMNVSLSLSLSLSLSIDSFGRFEVVPCSKI